MKFKIHEDNLFDAFDKLTTPMEGLTIEQRCNYDSLQIDFAMKGLGDVNYRDRKGATPVMRRALEGDLLGVKKLVALGADLSIRSLLGIGVQSYASTGGDEKVISYLKGLFLENEELFRVSNTESILEFFSACGNDDLEKVKSFIDNGMNVNVRRPVNGNTGAMQAAFDGSIKVLKYLFDQDACLGMRNNHNIGIMKFALRGKNQEVNSFLIKLYDKDNTLFEHGIFCNTKNYMYDELKILAYEIGSDLFGDVNSFKMRRRNPPKISKDSSESFVHKETSRRELGSQGKSKSYGVY